MEQIGTMKFKQATTLTRGEVLNIDPEASFQSAWYDHSYLLCEYTGTFDADRMRTAINNLMRVGERGAALGKFGGWSSCSDVTDLGEGRCMIEMIYHIGD